ncbi:DUF2461 domain-containing protein [Hyphomonas sp.]|uniref:DUF2461 domain-containing protein n=1 Tax=Hyphomonas sp. TaxID=87 RepID=UPI003F6EF6C3
MIPAKAFSLIGELDANNNKAWFDAHRQDIKDNVQIPFQTVLEAITQVLVGTPTPFRGGGQTMFRMNRDVRFSKDKTPYNPQVSGVLTRTGTKSEMAGLTFLCLDKIGGFAASGFYNLSPSDLGPIRDRIVEKPRVFADVVSELANAGYELMREDALKSMPRGYSEHADAPFAEFLKLKSFIVRRDLTRKDWTSGDVVEHVAHLTTSCSCLIRFGAFSS